MPSTMLYSGRSMDGGHCLVRQPIYLFNPFVSRLTVKSKVMKFLGIYKIRLCSKSPSGHLFKFGQNGMWELDLWLDVLDFQDWIGFFRLQTIRRETWSTVQFNFTLKVVLQTQEFCIGFMLKPVGFQPTWKLSSADWRRSKMMWKGTPGGSISVCEAPLVKLISFLLCLKARIVCICFGFLCHSVKQ